MTLNELLPNLLKLNHDDMLQAIEILKYEVGLEEPAKDVCSQALGAASYEVWSPQITLETAHILQGLLHEAS